MTRFTKEQMLEWLDETIKLEAGSDACFPNQKFPDHTIVKQIREIVANIEITPEPKKYLGPNVVNEKLFFLMLDGSTISCECIGQPYVNQIMQVWHYCLQNAADKALNVGRNYAS